MLITNLTYQFSRITLMYLAWGIPDRRLLSDINYLYLRCNLSRNTFIFIDCSSTLPNFKLSTNTFNLYWWFSHFTQTPTLPQQSVHPCRGIAPGLLTKYSKWENTFFFLFANYLYPHCRLSHGSFLSLLIVPSLYPTLYHSKNVVQSYRKIARTLWPNNYGEKTLFLFCLSIIFILIANHCFYPHFPQPFPPPNTMCSVHGMLYGKFFYNCLILQLVIFLHLSVIDVVLALVQEAPAGFLVQRLVQEMIPWTVWYTNLVSVISIGATSPISWITSAVSMKISSDGWDLYNKIGIIKVD